MPAKGSNYDNALLQLIFNGTVSDVTDWSSLVANSGSPATVLYVSLHTATLSATASQNTTEAAYNRYSRVAVARTSSGWTVSGSSVSPTSSINFPAATGGGEIEVAWAVGTAQTGAGTVLYYGGINPTISVSNGVTPSLTSASTITEQ
jgi:hypothetical protein